MSDTDAVVTVLVVEDHPIFRRGLRDSLTEVPGIEVVAEAADLAGAVEAAGRLRPGVVLMDIDLGADSGIDATSQVRAACPGTAVVALTMHDAEAVVLAAVEAGASGYVLKGADQEELAGAVRAAARGEAVFGAGVAGHVLSRLQQRGGPRRTPPAELGLTEREGEVLELMAQGWGNQAIAERLFLAPKTVRNNVSSILTKLQATDRGAAVVAARARGYGHGASTSD